MGSSEPQTWNTSFRVSQGRPSPVSHIPEKSGLPSAVRGVGAVRLGFPSGVRGTPAVGYFNHWAERSDETQTNKPRATDADDVKREGMVCSTNPFGTHSFGAARVALRDHRDRPDLRGVRHFVALGILCATREDEQRLFVVSA